MIAHLSRRYHFSASHRLHADTLTPIENAATFGKCNNPHGHGHNYAVTITVSGPVSPITGMVANLADLDAFARTHLLEPFHQTNLNIHPLFTTLVPTTENLAVALHTIFAAFPHATLTNLHIEETPNNSFDYAPTAQMGRYPS